MIQELASTITPGRIPDGFQLVQSRSPQKDLPALDLELRIIDNRQQLLQLVKPWQRLTEMAIEPNVFYEPQFLLPAMEYLSDKNTRVIVVEAPIRVCPDDRRVLCGLFPVQKKRSMRGIPVETLEMWQHDYCFLTTPLIRSDVADETIKVFLDWQQNHVQRLMHFPLLSSDGPVDRLLMEHLGRLGALRIVRDSHTRATIVRRESTPDIVQSGLSRKRRHELNRNRRKLAGLGRLDAAFYESGQDPVPWIEQFLFLESSGWKGRAQSDIHRNVADRNFFESIILSAAAADRLMMVRLQLDQQTIAMKINLLSANGAFCFKIAYDERYSKYSPGVLLEVENLKWLHRHTSQTEWMDSCAQPGHPMIDHVWPDRRKIESVVIPSRRRFASLAAASIPLCRAMKHRISKQFSNKER